MQIKTVMMAGALLLPMMHASAQEDTVFVDAFERGNFYIAANNVTVLCPDAAVGETDSIRGVEYTKRTKDQITPTNAATTCTTGITDLSNLFKDQTDFNADISHWDTSVVENISGLFENASSFNQDLGAWCAERIAIPPANFDAGATDWILSRPNWAFPCFALDETRTLTISSTAGGQLSREGEISVPIGRTQQFNVINEIGHNLTAITGCNGFMTGMVYVVNNITQDCSITATFSASDFYLDENLVTIKCPTASVGDSDEVYGRTVIKRLASEITPENAETTCTSGISDLSQLFFQETEFNGDITHWDTSSVTSMLETFYGAQAFNQPIGHWDTSSVTSMTRLFAEAYRFNQDIRGWDTSSVEYMNQMFWNTNTFNQDIGNWDTTSVIRMSGMFQGNESFNQDISSWDTSSVDNMNSMFLSADVFNQDLSTWCVSSIATRPLNFDFAADSWSLPRPNWGAPCD